MSCIKTTYLENVYLYYQSFGMMSVEWRIAHISSLHKNTDKRKCENYQEFNVTSSIGRLYGKILTNRVANSGYQRIQWV